MTGIEAIASRVVPSGEGYWAAGVRTEISYPAEHSDLCFSLEDQSFWFAHRNRAILAMIDAFPPPAGTILDVGGGNGFVTKALQESGREAVLLEPNPHGARNAVTRGVRQVICGDTESAGLVEGSLAAIGLFDVVEHISDDVAFLEALRPKLMPGGRIYLSVPAFSMLWSAEDVSAGHYRRYRAGTITRVLARAGFRVDYTTYIFALLPLPIFFLRTLPSLLRVRGETADTVRGEHGTAGRGAGLIDALLAPELALIRKRRRVPFGASCLVVASREA